MFVIHFTILTKLILVSNMYKTNFIPCIIAIAIFRIYVTKADECKNGINNVITVQNLGNNFLVCYEY